MRRRRILFTVSGLACLAGCSPVPNEEEANDPLSPGEMVTLVEFNSSGRPLGRVTVEQVVKSDNEWREQLSDRAYKVTRRKGTELAFTGRYNEHHEAGIYRCIACGNALFGANTKFDSGTGWPSFWAPLAEDNIYVDADRSLVFVREEVLCRRCNAHLGHVFGDGPAPTGLRYCINSAALRFEAADQ